MSAKKEIKKETKTYKYVQGQRIYFNMGPGLPCGYGKICGVVGPVIVVELELPIKDYPFTHFYILDSQITEPTIIPFINNKSVEMEQHH